MYTVLEANVTGVLTVQDGRERLTVPLYGTTMDMVTKAAQSAERRLIREALESDQD